MVALARRNLLAEKARFAMSVAGVGFAVLLILIVVSLYRGWSGVGKFYEQLPGDVWVAQTGTSDPFHSTSFLPLADRRVLARAGGVSVVVPVYARHISFTRGGRELDVFALALDLPAGMRASAGESAIAPGRIDIDRVLADQAGTHVGDTLNVLGRPLVVSRIHSGGNSIFETAYLNARDARAMFAIDHYANFFLLTLRRGTDVNAVAAAVPRSLPGTETHTSAQFAASFADRVNAGFLAVVGVLVGIGFVVGGAVIALTTYTATVERAREFGVLKAIGASGMFLYRVVMRQSLIVGTLGAAVGIAVSIAATRAIRNGVPEFITVLRPLDVAGVFVVAVLMSVVASYVPVRRIERIDPAEVFRA